MTHLMSRLATDDQAAWCTWVAGAAQGDIDIDNDGVMENTKMVVDLSQALSQRLGKQMSMMSTYKVNYIGIQLVNTDDLNDNDGAAEFSGRVHYHSPSIHKINAMELARQVEKRAEESDVDADSWLLATTSVYKGMRFNWDSDSQVAFATAEGFGALTGSRWDLAELFNVYNQMATDRMDDAANKLWSSGRCGYTEQIAFTTAYQNAAQTTDPGEINDMYSPSNTPFIYQTVDPIEVLGGLLLIDFEKSSTDSPAINDDDYQVMITIGVTGWRDF